MSAPIIQTNASSNPEAEKAPAQQGAPAGGGGFSVDELKPRLLATFEGEDVTMLPRPELALRIGQVVTEELDRTQASLNLLERRKLVGELIDWVILCSPKKPQAEAPAEKAPGIPPAWLPMNGL